MSLLVPNGKVIVFNFPAGAGGKMLQNCTALSRHCVIKKPSFAAWQIKQQQFDSDFYKQKLKWVLATVPERLEFNGWLRYELRDDHMYGLSFPDFFAHKPMANRVAQHIADAGLWTTITAHNYDSAIEHFELYWPTVKHVSLINSSNFAKKCLPFKNPWIEFDETWETQGRSDPDLCYNFDIDSTIYDTDLFCESVEKLYNYLGFDDYQKHLVAEYHRAYIKIH